jgi:glutathione S-transferase
MTRVECQIDSALSWLEEFAPAPWLLGDRMSRADVTTAIAFTYMVEKHRGLLDCEALSQFVRAAYSPAEAEQSGRYPET